MIVSHLYSALPLDKYWYLRKIKLINQNNHPKNASLPYLQSNLIPEILALSHLKHLHCCAKKEYLGDTKSNIPLRWKALMSLFRRHFQYILLSPQFTPNNSSSTLFLQTRKIEYKTTRLKHLKYALPGTRTTEINMWRKKIKTKLTISLNSQYSIGRPMEATLK